ncbi:hypothetical protein [Acidithiobacillus ferrianus]|uniref:hypothetical protein n=1 Tax=Acidithiobacillus ferrianus TaxID=2678518 RepID=UPI0034E607E6
MLKRILFAIIALGTSGIAFATTPYAGKWEARFSGGDQGHCAIQIQVSGRLTGICHGRKEGNTPFQVAGFVRGSTIHFGIAETGAQFAGYLKGSHGKGTWRNTGDGGTWSVSKDA